MHPASVVPFATEAEAQQVGYRRAKDCLGGGEEEQGINQYMLSSVGDGKN
jgi:hypothetical protein